MKLLFIGDSITKGEIGESFTDLLNEANPAWIINNAGANGDTLKNISNRLKAEITFNANYDYIVIEAGHNDIILPDFKNKGFLFRLALKHLLKSGREPLDVRDFEKEYVRTIEFVRKNTDAKIILTTLNCINENLLSDLNQARKKYNETIRAIAQRFNCLLADISNDFDMVLQNRVNTDYLLGNFLNAVYFDKKTTGRQNGADKISKSRKLVLTIDGVHLNSTGAKIYKEVIEKLITKDSC